MRISDIHLINLINILSRIRDWERNSLKMKETMNIHIQGAEILSRVTKKIHT